MSTQAILNDVPQEALESFIKLVVLVAYADGELSAKEEQLLTRRMVELSAGRVNEEWVRGWCVDLSPASCSSDNWRADLIQSIQGALTGKTLRLAAFQLAAEVAQAEAGLGTRESLMLANLAAELGLAHEEIKDFIWIKLRK